MAAAERFLETEAFREYLGEGFSLELLNKRHDESVLRWRGDARVFGSFRVARPLKPEDHNRFLSDYPGCDRVDFVLIDTERVSSVGVFYLTGISTVRPEIGKYIGEAAYVGRGIAKRATRALLTFAFEWLNLEVLYAVTRTDNRRNILLNEGLGFRAESTERVGDQTFIIMRLARP